MKKLTKESETLFIPLYSKAEVHQYGDILKDEKAAEIVSSVDYDFDHAFKSRFLTIYMGIRAAILDEYVRTFIQTHEHAIIITLGCGLDARCLRVSGDYEQWYDLDLTDVISVRKNYYQEDERYHMIASSVLSFEWLNQIQISDQSFVLIVAEGLTMYLSEEENKALILALKQKFKRADYVFDAYSKSAVWWSKYKNPVNAMGAVIRWGLDDPNVFESLTAGIGCTAIRSFTEKQWSDKLSGLTKWAFRLFYANSWADKLYRIYYFQLRS